TWHVGSEHSAAYHTNKVCSPWGPPGMASFVRTHPTMSVGAEESTPKSFCSVMDSSLISIDAFCQPTRAHALTPDVVEVHVAQQRLVQTVPLRVTDTTLMVRTTPDGEQVLAQVAHVN